MERKIFPDVVSLLINFNEATDVLQNVLEIF